jgi:hypothetical protein
LPAGFGSNRQTRAGGQITIKHDDPTISTFRAISIDSSARSENDCVSIRPNCESDSKAIDAKNSHRGQQDYPRISVFRGISIKANDEDEKAMTPRANKEIKQEATAIIAVMSVRFVRLF